MVSKLSALYKREARQRKNDVTAQKIDLTGGENPPLDEGDEMYAEEQTSGTKSYADMMKQTNSSNSSENLQVNSNNLMSSSHDWKVVQEKTKTLSRPFIGKTKGASLKPIQTQRRPADVFISRLNPDTTAAEVEGFVSAQFKSACSVSCRQLQTKYNTYSSFYLQIDGISFDESLNLDNWPEGLLVKRYYKRNDMVDYSLRPSAGNLNDVDNNESS